MSSCCPRFLSLLVRRRRPKYEPLAADAPRPSAETRALFGELQRGDAEAREAVRLKVGERMQVWTDLMNLAVAGDETTPRDLAVIRWLLEDSGVHILYWSFGIWREAAQANDRELVDLFLQVFRAKSADQAIDAHFVVTRTGFCLQGAAEGGHMDLVRHIDAVCRADFGMLMVMAPKNPHPSIAEECRQWFSQEHQMKLLRGR